MKFSLRTLLKLNIEGETKVDVDVSVSEALASMIGKRSNQERITTPEKINNIGISSFLLSIFF